VSNVLESLREQVQGALPARTAASPWARPVALAVAVGIAYFLAARLSLLLLTEPDGVAVFWPAAGVAAGVLIALGPSARIPVAAGAMVATIVANLMGDRTFSSTIVFAICNAGEALLTGWLIERYFGPDFTLDRLVHVMGLLAAAIIGTTVSGIGGTIGFVYFQNTNASVLTIWHHWFASDALGIITIAPLIIEIAAARRHPPPRHELIEGLLAICGLVLMALFVILLPKGPLGTAVPIALLFPLLLWLAARCRPVFSAAAVFIIALTVVWMTTFGIGHFFDPSIPPNVQILRAQATILATSLCAFVLASLFAERRLHAAALEEREARLQEALAAGGVMAFEWDVGAKSSRRSDNAPQILGFDAKEPFTARDFLARVHPDDRQRLRAHIYSVRPDKPSYKATFRFSGPNGREIWLEESSRAEYDATGRYVRLKGLTLDITERKQAEERQNLLVAELDHRVKNLLASVAVITMYTREGSSSVDEFVKTLDQRIQSMANAHLLLSQSRWHGVNLGNLVRDQLAPYATSANTTVGGPDVTLNAAATKAVAMVLHELVTNAVKYGALSTPTGHVSLTWVKSGGGDAPPRVIIEWRESGGPPVGNVHKPSYGTSLIRDLIPHELGGSVDLTFAPEGAYCRIEIPIEPR